MASILADQLQLSPTPQGLPRRDDEIKAEGDLPELFRRLKDQFKAADRATDKWRTKARGWLAFLAGHQWEDKILSAMEEQGRPALTFDRTAAVIDAVSGTEIANRQEICVYPREQGDVQKSEAASAGIDWVRDRAFMDSEETRAFSDMLAAGMGWTETRIDHMDDPEGMIWKDRVDPLSMWWDPMAEKRNLADARFLFRLKVVDVYEARALFPDSDPDMLDARWTGVSDGYSTTSVDLGKRDFEANNYSRGPDLTKPVRLVQAQWWERERVFMVSGPDGPRGIWTKEEVSLIQGMDGYEVTETYRKRYRWAILGDTVLKHGDLDPSGSFHFHCITGKWDDRDKNWYGIMQAMMDPQMWANKLMSAAIFIFASQGKGGVIAEVDAFEDPESAKRDWAKPNAFILANAGAVSEGRIQDKPVGELPTSIGDLTTFALEAIREAAGVPVELLAQQESDQLSGVQEYERKRAGLTLLAPYFDSLRLYRQISARTLFDFIRAFMQERLVKIVSEGQQQYIPLILDPDVADYDLVVDESPASPNQRERTWQLLLPILQALLASQQPIPPKFYTVALRASPLPSSVVEELIAAVSEPEEQDPEAAKEAEEQKQLVIRQVLAAIAKDEAGAEKDRAAAVLNIAKAQDIGYQGQMQSAEFVRDSMNAEQDRETEVEEKDKDRQHAANEGERTRRNAIETAAQRKNNPSNKNRGS